VQNAMQHQHYFPLILWRVLQVHKLFLKGFGQTAKPFAANQPFVRTPKKMSGKEKQHS
jgi:hypothetical protein